MKTFHISTPSSSIKRKTKSLGTNKAEAKGVGFPKIITFGSISAKLMAMLAKIGLKKELIKSIRVMSVNMADNNLDEDLRR